MAKKQKAKLKDEDITRKIEDFVNNTTYDYQSQKAREVEIAPLNSLRPKVAEEINEILRGITEIKIEPSDFHFTSQCLIDSSTPYRDTGKFRDVVFNYYSSRIKEGNFLHFTTLRNFESIYNSKTLKFFSLFKRFSQDEFVTFYKDHNLRGYESQESTNSYSYKQLMQGIFYMSFISKEDLTEETTDNSWRSFGEDGAGVMCEFEIKAKTADFRTVFYKDKQLLLFHKIDSFLQEKYNRRLFIPSISKLGAFYLQGDFSTENETRFAIKKETYEYKFNEKIIGIGKDAHLNLKLNNRFGNFKLKSVYTKSKATFKEIEDLFHKRRNKPQLILVKE